MSDSFQGVADITLQPGSAGVPYSFTFAACSSATANDGSLPYNTTISSAAVKAFDKAGADVTDQMIASDSLSTPVVTVALKYPATSGEGKYSIEFVLTLDSGAKMEFDFTRVYAEDIAV